MVWDISIQQFNLFCCEMNDVLKGNEDDFFFAILHINDGIIVRESPEK